MTPSPQPTTPPMHTCPICLGESRDDGYACSCCGGLGSVPDEHLRAVRSTQLDGHARLRRWRGR